jgi:hypothetical protein
MCGDRPNKCRRKDQKEEPKNAAIFLFLFHEYYFFETIFAKLGQLPQKVAGFLDSQSKI